MHTVFLALGTNLGDRLANLNAAVTALPPEVVVMVVSSVYQTPPWGYEDQPAFLNMALHGETTLSPEALLAYVKNLETELGRVVSFHYGPRRIDIDILFYDDLVINTPTLDIPHPRLQERAFVLVPLAEIARDFIHPLLKVGMGELLKKVDVAGIQKYAE